MAKKIALIEPRIPAGESLGIEKSPMSIQMLAGQFTDTAHQVKMFHETAGDTLYKKLADFAPDILGISTMTANFIEGKKAAEAMKKIRSEVKIILGGWHASGCAQAYLKKQENESIMEIMGPDSPFDLAVAGEGDAVFPELVRRLDKGLNITDLQGVIYRETEKIRASVAARIKNLDTLADPSWKDLPIDNYRDKRSGALDLSIHAKRACRFDCGFCSTGTVYGRGVTALSAQRTVAQIENIARKLHPETITFTDEDFFANLKWIAETVALLEEKKFPEKYGIALDTFISIFDLNRMENKGYDSLLEKMKKVGFKSFTMGVESLNANILREYNKEPMILPTMDGQTRQYYEYSQESERDKLLEDHYMKTAQKAIDYAQAHGFIVVGDYIIGNLGESEEEVRAGFAKFAGLKNLHFAYLPIYTPFPGTKLWKKAYDSGKILRTTAGGIDWSKFNGSAGALNLGYDVNGLRNKLEIRFYTSDRYHADMRRAIKHDPNKRLMFKHRFEYIERKFPGNKTVAERLRELI